MNELTRLALAFVAGALLSASYFAALWWTVRRLVDSRHPRGVYFSSLLVRLSVLLSAFAFLIISFPAQLLAASLLGFLPTRFALTHWIAQYGDNANTSDHGGMGAHSSPMFDAATAEEIR